MIAEATATFNSRAKKLKYPMSNQTRGRQCPKLFFVVSALCADFEPEARRYTKLGQHLILETVERGCLSRSALLTLR